MLPILQIGPVSLPVAPLVLLIGFWIALNLTEAHAPRYQVDPNQIYQMVLFAVLAGIIGARLAFAARSPNAFIASPLSLLALQPQMLDSSGGLLAAGLIAFIYAQRKNMPLWSTLDTLTTLFALLAVAFGLSHFASGDSFGAPAQLPWSIFLWGENRHPSQVYETLAALAIAAAVWPGNKFANGISDLIDPGGRFWVFVTFSSAARLFLEAFRGDSILLFDSIRLVQVIAWCVMALSLWQLHRRFRSQVNPKTI